MCCSAAAWQAPHIVVSIQFSRNLHVIARGMSMMTSSLTGVFPLSLFWQRGKTSSPSQRREISGSLGYLSIISPVVSRTAARLQGHAASERSWQPPTQRSRPPSPLGGQPHRAHPMSAALQRCSTPEMHQHLSAPAGAPLPNGVAGDAAVLQHAQVIPVHTVGVFRASSESRPAVSSNCHPGLLGRHGLERVLNSVSTCSSLQTSLLRHAACQTALCAMQRVRPRPICCACILSSPEFRRSEKRLSLRDHTLCSRRLHASADSAQ